MSIRFIKLSRSLICALQRCAPQKSTSFRVFRRDATGSSGRLEKVSVEALSGLSGTLTVPGLREIPDGSSLSSLLHEQGEDGVVSPLTFVIGPEGVLHERAHTVGSFNVSLSVGGV